MENYFKKKYLIEIMYVKLSQQIAILPNITPANYYFHYQKRLDEIMIGICLRPVFALSTYTMRTLLKLEWVCTIPAQEVREL